MRIVPGRKTGDAYTSVFLGEQPASKTGGRGSNPRARACRRGRTARHRFCKPIDAGANPVVGSISRSCNGTHGTVLSDQPASMPVGARVLVRFQVEILKHW